MIEMPSLPELTFEESKHVYRLNGVALPSVTTIMQPLSDDVYGSIDPDVLNRAAARGTAVHNAIEVYTKYGIEDIQQEHRGYFEAFLRWYKERKVVSYGSEIRLYHRALLYAGTADMAAEMDGEDTLVDFKTSSSVQPMLGGVQLEAYNRCFMSHHLGEFKRRAIVHLKSDGTYQVHHFVDASEYWRVFTALLTVRNYKLKFKK